MYKNVVYALSIFEPGMHATCFNIVLLLYDVDGNGMLLLSEKFKQQATVFIAVTNAMFTIYSFPGICNLAHYGNEIAKDYDLVVCRSDLETVFF